METNKLLRRYCMYREKSGDRGRLSQVDIRRVPLSRAFLVVLHAGSTLYLAPNDFIYAMISFISCDDVSKGFPFNAARMQAFTCFLSASGLSA